MSATTAKVLKMNKYGHLFTNLPFSLTFKPINKAHVLRQNEDNPMIQPEIILRAAQPADESQIRTLLVDLDQFYPGAQAWLTTTLAQIWTGLAHADLAWRDDHLVGLLIDKPKPDGRRKLSTIYVAPEATGQGVFRALLDQAQRRWWTARLREVYVTVRIPRADTLVIGLTIHGFVPGPILTDRYGPNTTEQVFVWRPAYREALFSLWPFYAEALWCGEKRYEFRRTRVSLQPGDRVLVYETRPISAVTGEFLVGGVFYEKVPNLRKITARGGGPGLDEYLTNVKWASALRIVDPIKYPSPRPLAAFGLRHPPLSYQFLTKTKKD
jgi:predicted transcriptional regulator